MKKKTLPNRLRSSQKIPNSKTVDAAPKTPGIQTPSPSSSAISQVSEVKSPNAYGYFKQISAKEQFLAIVDSAKTEQFFMSSPRLPDVFASFTVQLCGGRYGVGGL